MQKKNNTWLITEANGLREFVGIADEKALKELSAHIAMLGFNAANVSPITGNEEEDRKKFYETQIGYGLSLLTTQLMEYDVVIGFITDLQIMFLVRMEDTCDPRNIKQLNSYKDVVEAKGERGFLPLTTGVILNFGKYAGLYDDEESNEDKNEEQ